MSYVYSDMTYCTLCDRYFPGEEARAQHVQYSTNHPKCDKCDRRFANKNSLRNHYVYSPRHHYCAVCEKNFLTAAGLRVHIEYAAVHRDDSDDDSDDEVIDDSSEGWEDELGATAFPEENIPPANSEDEEDPNYWTDDDAEDFEEEREKYFESNHHRAALAARAAEPAPAETSSDARTGAAKDPECPKSDEARSGVFISCPLCLEAPKETSVTKCGHLFCTPCIRTALSGKKMCPVCRDFSVPQQLRKVYLPTIA